jgi:hypothetical protein
MINIKQVINYLSEHISDCVPKYIFVKEILKKDPSSPEYTNAYNNMIQSKWYRELADEQWEDGSWGRFHSMDSKVPKQKFATTEAALRRSLELSLSKDDPMIVKCIRLLARYVRGEETWTDNIEKHKDNGKGHMFCRPFMSAAVLNMFDPENPVIKPLRDVVAETLRTAFVSGTFNDVFWEQKVKEYHVPSIVAPGSLYGSMLMQNGDCLDDTLQRQWLDYIWKIKGGIYYVSNVPPADKQYLENKLFIQWLSTLELLSGFSLFPDFMKEDIFPHLLNETERLIKENVELSHIKTNRYADSWRDKNVKKLDAALRIARILVKC